MRHGAVVRQILLIADPRDPSVVLPDLQKTSLSIGEAKIRFVRNDKSVFLFSRPWTRICMLSWSDDTDCQPLQQLHSVTRKSCR